MSLRLRLILLTLAVFVPALVTALWVIHGAYDSERASLERGLRETTRALSLVVDREMSQRETIARILADSPYLDAAPDLTESDLRNFYEQARVPATASAAGSCWRRRAPSCSTRCGRSAKRCRSLVEGQTANYPVRDRAPKLSGLAKGASAASWPRRSRCR